MLRLSGRISQRAHIPQLLFTCPTRLVPSAVAALPASHSNSLIPHQQQPHRFFAAEAASSASAKSAAAPKGRGKKGVDAASETLPDIITTGAVYDEFNIIPPQPKPKYEELVQACLTEEQLRFAKRPMPSSEHRKELLPSIYLGEKPIAEHTAEDLGKYYHVTPAIMSSIPTHIHRSMAQEFMGGGPYQMVRNPGWDIVQQLKSIESGGDKAKEVKQRVFGIRGESGCGKSAALHYICQFAREQSRSHPSKPWLLIGTRAEEFTCETKGFIQPSATKPGTFDQALYTMEFFSNMLKTESEALKKIRLKRHKKYADEPITWPEGQAPGETLFDLVTLASQDRVQAPRLLYDFTAELKRATEIPVLIVMDNLNSLDQVCEFVEPYTYEHMDPRKLALVDAFSWFHTKPPGNGASVWSLTTKHATLRSAHEHFQHRSVAGMDTWWYSTQELKHCVVHYSVSEFILSEVNQDLLVRINGLTGKVPRDVFKQAFLR